MTTKVIDKNKMNGSSPNGHHFDEQKSLVDPRNILNELPAKKWIVETISVWVQKGLGAKHPDTKIERQHPAPFSFTDVSRLVCFFSKQGQTVLDPFVGVGSTLKACALENRNGIGFELNPRYAELAAQRLQQEVRSSSASESKQKIVTGDSRTLIEELDENTIDFVVTSPPYWNILHKKDHKAKQERIANGLDTQYSNHALDLGNIDDYESFLHELSAILGGCGRVLKPQKYMAIIVSDFRDKSKYVMFHSHLAEALAPYQLELRGIKILHQKQKRVFPYGYPYAYVPNIHHQYVLILQNAKIS